VGGLFVTEYFVTISNSVRANCYEMPLLFIRTEIGSYIVGVKDRGKCISKTEKRKLILYENAETRLKR
jgi:hypothetical protein